VIEMVYLYIQTALVEKGKMKEVNELLKKAVELSAEWKKKHPEFKNYKDRFLYKWYGPIGKLMYIQEFESYEQYQEALKLPPDEETAKNTEKIIKLIDPHSYEAEFWSEVEFKE
jgi:hypothetical protein